jgi:hypothetical protein
MFKPSSLVNDLDREYLLEDFNDEPSLTQDDDKRQIMLTAKEYHKALESAKENALYGAARGWDEGVNKAWQSRIDAHKKDTRREALSSAAELLKTQWPAAANVIKEFAKIS